MYNYMKNNKRGGAIIPDAVKKGTEHQNLVEDEDCEKYIEDLELGKIDEQYLASDLINGEYNSKCDPIFRPEETNVDVSKVQAVGKRIKEFDIDDDDQITEKTKEIQKSNPYATGGKRKSRKQKSRKNKSKKNKSRRHRKKRN